MHDMESDQGPAAAGPLAGVRVADFTHVLAGPYCSQLLADAGANVVKIEPPGGEYARVRGPRRIGPDGTMMSTFSLAVNRGKRSIALDLKNAAGREVAREIALHSDVVVQNFTPGVMERLGLGLASLRAAQPRLVTVSITLFGDAEGGEGSAGRSGLAIIAEGESSIAYMPRAHDGGFVDLGYPLGDMATGMAAFGAVTAALLARQRTGIGAHVDISMVHTLLALNTIAVVGSQIEDPTGATARTAGYGIFPTVDGHATIGVNSDALFARLAEAMDRPDLSSDPRFAHYTQRDTRIEEVNEIVSRWTGGRTTDQVVEALSAARIPVGRLNTPHDVLGDRHLNELGYFESLDDRLGGGYSVPSSPMTGTPTRRLVPFVGEHRDDVLSDMLRLDAAAIAALHDAGAFGLDDSSDAP